MEKPMTEIFSHNLRNALYMKGMTQAELAKAVIFLQVLLNALCAVAEWAVYVMGNLNDIDAPIII